jgi:hypothetical protein
MKAHVSLVKKAVKFNYVPSRQFRGSDSERSGDSAATRSRVGTLDSGATVFCT